MIEPWKDCPKCGNTADSFWKVLDPSGAVIYVCSKCWKEHQRETSPPKKEKSIDERTTIEIGPLTLGWSYPSTSLFTISLPGSENNHRMTVSEMIELRDHIDWMLGYALSPELLDRLLFISRLQPPREHQVILGIALPLSAIESLQALCEEDVTLAVELIILQFLKRPFQEVIKDYEKIIQAEV